ncbi:hypothetical protein ScPMuIL_000749 [Solemya velum]
MGPGHLVIDEAVNVQIGSNHVLAVNEPDICCSDPEPETEVQKEGNEMDDADDQNLFDGEKFKLDLTGNCFVERRGTGIVLRQFEPRSNVLKEASFSLRRWKELEWTMPRINEAVEEAKKGKDVRATWHLGGNLIVTVDKRFPTVDIRHFDKLRGSDEPRPTRKGVAMRLDRFKSVVELMPHLIPELEKTVPCYMRDDHQNQLGFLQCPECNPNDCVNW